MKVLYFAWIRSRIGVGEETLSPPAEVISVADLVAWIATLSPAHAEALARPDLIRVAVDQEFASSESPILGAEEVALFPPVTGGGAP